MVQSYKIEKVTKKIKNEVKTKEKNNKKNNKKNSKGLVIGIALIIVLLIGGLLVIYFKNYNEPTNKLKRYLVNNNYECNKSNCRKTKDNITYIVSYKKDDYQVLSDSYTLNISSKTPYVVVKNNSMVCSYEREDYETFMLIDDTFSYDKKCSKYIDVINENIKEYKHILSNAHVEIDEFKK